MGKRDTWVNLKGFTIQLLTVPLPSEVHSGPLTQHNNYIQMGHKREEGLNGKLIATSRINVGCHEAVNYNWKAHYLV